MKKHLLSLTKRETFGKKLKALRKQGILPAHIFGKTTESMAVQLPLSEFLATFKEAGTHGVLELHVDGEKKPALISHFEVHPVSGDLLHVDFQQVNLKEKIHSMIPVELIGEAPAVAENLGTLLHIMNEVEVEALPTDLPEKFELDITPLIEVDQALTVADLPTTPEVAILSEPDQIVAKIAAITVEPEPEPVVEEGAEGEETAPAEGEGEATEGETPAEPTEESAPQQ
ncbi:MAG TPA: 50S ribosomal protein L25 [Patescibacteria group bacterium]|nr:50S ribosomal protein L25 [Patescibacteria group bacterium]